MLLHGAGKGAAPSRLEWTSGDPGLLSSGEQ